MQSSLDDPLLRIQREISEVVEREHELRNGHITPPKQNNDVSLPPRTLQRALSSSTLTLSYNSNPTNAKRFAPNPDHRGLMQRFIKSRGKLSMSAIAPVKDQTFMAWEYDSLPAKIQIPPGKLIRKGYVPVEERIQQELREMQNREAELKAHQRKTLAASQPDLLAILDGTDTPPESPPPSTIGKLRGARSMAHLCDSDDLPDDTVSAPSSLRPAVSLVQLCSDLNDTDDVPSSSSLIAKFESIIQQNRANGHLNNL